MESITIKVDEKMAKAIEQAMNPLYTTKSEFVRAALREKLEEMQRRRISEGLRKNFGRGTKQTTSEEERRIREEVGREYAKKFGIDLE